jgi:hypothetical protein
MCTFGDPDRDTLAIVTLTVRDPRVNFVLPQRQITLTEQNPSVRVGRASKVAAKGFIAGSDNAWFDSPVMSREHAELIANFDTKASIAPISRSTYQGHGEGFCVCD